MISGRKEQGQQRGAEGEGDPVYLGWSGKRGFRAAGRELLGAWGEEQEGWGAWGVGLALGASQVTSTHVGLGATTVTWPALPPKGWGWPPSGSQKFRVGRAEGREQTLKEGAKLKKGCGMDALRYF